MHFLGCELKSLCSLSAWKSCLLQTSPFSPSPPQVPALSLTHLLASVNFALPMVSREFFSANLYSGLSAGTEDVESCCCPPWFSSLHPWSTLGDT